MRRPHQSLSALMAAALVAATPHQASTRQARPADERARALLAIDFGVVAADGTPVTDLRPEEIEIRISGRPRIVRSLQVVTAPAASGTGLPAPFGTNAAGAEGRDVILIVDDDSFRPGREAPLREAVAAFVDGLESEDRLGLVTMPYGGVKVPLTSEHRRVVTALTQVVGGSPRSETGSELACRSRRTLESLTGYLQTLGYRDSPAFVVFVTAGLAAPRRDAALTRGPGMCEMPVEAFQHVGHAAAGTRARFYIVQPVDLINAGTVIRENIAGAEYRGSDNPIEGIEHLAGVTGGKQLALAGSPGGALGRILRETSSYYVAAIEPAETDRRGRPLPLDVRVSRPGVEVRARPQIAFPRPERVGRATPVNPSPRDMLSVTRVFRDLPLRVAAYVSLDADAKTLRVTTVAEPIEANTQLTALVAALFDQEGKSVGSWVATPSELARSPVVGAMAVPPGAYRLRTAAIDAEGRGGTADYDVLVDLAQTGPVKISSLILGLSRDGAFIPRLQFSNEPVAIGLLELYGGQPGMKVTATLEVARTLNGPSLTTAPLAVSAAAGRYTARGAIPLAALAPGDYAVRAIIGVDGHPPTRVVRTLRKH